MEREADRIGFGVLTGAGFAPAGMAAMFEKLDQASRLNDNGSYPYLRSHPLTTERIGEARARLGTAASKAMAPALGAGSPFEHALAQARARVLMDTRVDALRRWQGLDAERSERQRRAARGRRLRQRARVDAAEGAGARRRRARAGRGAARQHPRQDVRALRQLAFLKAQLQLGRGDARAAAAALRALRRRRLARRLDGCAPRWRSRCPTAATPRCKRSADELQTLGGRAAGRRRRPGRCCRACGAGSTSRCVRCVPKPRRSYALGDLPGAIDRLRAGQRLARTAAARRTSSRPR